MRIVSIVGARPQFVKVAVIGRVLASDPAARGVEHKIIHTGQHYDRQMSAVFFEELGIAEPDYNLEVGSGSQGAQTGEMLKRLEPILAEERPDWVLLYGDTNSTLAGAVAAAKIAGPRIAHLEAGLRSFNRLMPEEINRIVADHLSHLLLCPTAQAVKNLEREGLAGRAVLTGDVMYDAVLEARVKAEGVRSPLAETWRAGEFALATVHRAENTGDPGRLHEILDGLEGIAAGICPVLLPLHPRTRKILAAEGWQPRALTIADPISYHEMLLLETRARFILTDSGGVQKEAYFAHKPCITLRDETEWVETLAHGCNVLAGACAERIVAAAKNSGKAGPWTSLYGDGAAGNATLRALLGA